jgi:hypothetical protein
MPHFSNCPELLTDDCVKKYSAAYSSSLQKKKRKGGGGILNGCLMEFRKSSGNRVCGHAVSVLVLHWSVAHQHNLCYWFSILWNCAVLLKNKVSIDLHLTETDV